MEADIRGFFDNVDHEWLMKMLPHDIADRKFPERGKIKVMKEWIKTHRTMPLEQLIEPTIEVSLFYR